MADEAPSLTQIDGREERLFRALDVDNDHHVWRREFEEMLRLAGLSALAGGAARATGPVGVHAAR